MKIRTVTKIPFNDKLWPVWMNPAVITYSRTYIFKKSIVEEIYTKTTTY